LTVRPPGGGAPIIRESSPNDQTGVLALSQTLPLKGSPNSGGDWGVMVEAIGGQQTPFQFYVLGDDTGLNAEQTAFYADYAVGDQIRVQARITELGRPVTGLNSQPGAQIRAQLLRPGASIGDLLSDAPAAPATPTAPDPASATEARLQKLLADNPDALSKKQDQLTLFDDGDQAHGDEVAGDGIYSALFPTQLEGHYNFLFVLEGNTPATGRFSRQQLRTVYVRPIPDGNRTEISSILRINDGRTHVVSFTPRTKFGNRMGPGWANYFWLTGPGIAPIKPVDNLNGTYTAIIPFTGARLEKIHFLRVSTVIDDSVTANNLPAPLDNTNAMKNVPTPKLEVAGQLSLLLATGANIPHGAFNQVFDPGASFAADLEYRLSNNFSLLGVFGYNRFRNSLTGPDLNLYNFSGNAKIYLGGRKQRPFVNFGGGAYKFDLADTRGGVNVGFGLQRELNARFAVEGAYNFHAVLTPGTSTKFSTLQLGIRIKP
jgi:hypothetical protein